MIPLCELELKNKREENEKVKTLYNSTGSNELIIELNDNIKNYDEYEVFYSLDGPRGAIKNVRAKINEVVALEGSLPGYFDGRYAIRLISSSAYIADNILYKTAGYSQDLTTSGILVFHDSLNGIYIHRIIGYKK